MYQMLKEKSQKAEFPLIPFLGLNVPSFHINCLLKICSTSKTTIVLSERCTTPIELT